MTPEKLAETIRQSGAVGEDAIELSAMSDKDVIDEYLRCSCCNKRCIESDTDVEFLILQSNNQEDFDRNVFVHIHGGPLSTEEQALVEGVMLSVTKNLLLRLGVERQLGLIKDEKLAQEVYYNLCQYVSHYISDSVNQGFKAFAQAHPKS
jgi:hypothetical protein